MKRMLLAVLLLAAQVASGQTVEPQVNGIGIYFDEESTCYCTTPSAFSRVTGYVVATNVDPCLGGIYGVEFKLLYDELPAPPIAYVPTTSLPVIELPFCRYCLIAPCAPAIRLLVFQFVCPCVPVRFGIGPHVPSSGDGTTPMVCAGNDPTLWVPLYPTLTEYPWCGENCGYALAWVGDCAIPAAKASWGEIKTLYR